MHISNSSCDAPLRVGVVGIGFWALARHLPRLNRRSDVVISAVCSRSQRGREVAAKMFGVETGFADFQEMLKADACDAVVICTPHALHGSQAILAIDRGLPTLVEKPLALIPAQAREIASMTEHRQGLVQVALDRRFRPGLRQLKEKIGTAIPGPVAMVIILSGKWVTWAYTGKPPPEYIQWLTGKSDEDGPNFRANRRISGGGVIVDLGTHILDQVVWLLGEDPEYLSCHFLELINEIETAAHIRLSFRSGHRVEIKIDVTANALNQDVCLLTDADGNRWRVDEAGPLIALGNDPYSLELNSTVLGSPTDAFIEAALVQRLQWGRLSNVRHAAKIVALVDACNQSAALGGQLWKL